MTNPSKSKGDRFERESVGAHEKLGITCERTYLAPQAARRNPGDLRIDARFSGECKSRKGGNSFKTLEDWLADHDLLFLRRDRKPYRVYMTHEMYEYLIKQATINEGTNGGS